MIDVLFVLPDDNGLENPSGKVFEAPCSEDAPIRLLFDTMRNLLGVEDVRLSLEAMQGDTVALLAIDPHDSATVGSRVTSGARIIVGFRREE